MRLASLALISAFCTSACSKSTVGLADTTTPLDTARFHIGADISALAAPLPPGTTLPPYQENGVASDELTILERHGWNAFRLRVFVSPVRDAPDNSLANTIALARRIKASGAIFLLDIHYSDTWADPGKQFTPAAWDTLGLDALEQRVQSYSDSTIRTLADSGAMPDWVQVGNEVTGGMLWPLGKLNSDDSTQWNHFTRLLSAGISGVKGGAAAAGKPAPKILIHIDRGGDWGATEWFFDHIRDAGVDYDVIAESFYPPWAHGTLAQLKQTMTQSVARYNKDFLVVETGYGPSQVPNNPDMAWPVTPAGRAQFMVDLINTLRTEPRALGVMYWAPEWDAWNADGTPGPIVFTLQRFSLR